jgi:broad-specificity NMP kinase
MHYSICMACIQEHLALLFWSDCDCDTVLHCSSEGSLIVATHVATVVGFNTVTLLRTIHRQIDHLLC